MKAREYYTKYKERIASTDDKVSLQGVCDMICELSSEAKEMITKRNIRTNRGSISVLRELNDKYNAICRMFEKEYGASPIKKDGFMSYWRNQIPELDTSLRRKDGGYNNVVGSV